MIGTLLTIAYVMQGPSSPLPVDIRDVYIIASCGPVDSTTQTAALPKPKEPIPIDPCTRSEYANYFNRA